MEDRINQALAQLEKDLEGINSARIQVESTVKASTDLQSIVREYVSSVKALCVSLQSWEADLRGREGSLSHEYEMSIQQVSSICNEITSSFGTEVGKTSADFKAKTEPVIDKFSAQIDKLEKHVQELNSLRDEIKKTTGEIESVKETLTQISKDLKDSQDSQDEVLGVIKEHLSELPSTIKGYTDDVLEQINVSKEGLKKILDESAPIISAIDSKMDALAQSVQNVQTSCNGIQRSCDTINTSLDEAKASIISSQVATAKAININRWIMIAAFIILLIIHFIK